MEINQGVERKASAIRVKTVGSKSLFGSHCNVILFSRTSVQRSLSPPAMCNDSFKSQHGVGRMHYSN